jgi:hypothetical protein
MTIKVCLSKNNHAELMFYFNKISQENTLSRVFSCFYVKFLLLFPIKKDINLV